MFNIDATVRRLSRREKREEATPLVIYNRGYYSTARLATIRDYLALDSWPPDYSVARVITNPDDLEAIGRAEDTIRSARLAAEKTYAQAYARGETIDPEQAETAAQAIGD